MDAILIYHPSVHRIGLLARLRLHYGLTLGRSDAGGIYDFMRCNNWRSLERSRQRVDYLRFGSAPRSQVVED